MLKKSGVRRQPFDKTALGLTAETVRNGLRQIEAAAIRGVH